MLSNGSTRPLTRKLTSNDARGSDNRALRVACVNGHLDVALWLVNTYKLTANDLNGAVPEQDGKYLLQRVKDNGHNEMYDWMRHTFDL